MPLHAYRVGNSTHTHEYQGFRKLAETLRIKNINQTICVAGNPALLEVAYRYPKSDL